MEVQIKVLLEKYLKELTSDVEAKRVLYWEQASEAFHIFWKNKIMDENAPDLRGRELEDLDPIIRLFDTKATRYYEYNTVENRQQLESRLINSGLQYGLKYELEDDQAGKTLKVANASGAATVIVPQPEWYKIFYDLKSNQTLRQKMNEILFALMDKKPGLIDELATINETNNNALTTPASIPLSAIMTINAPEQFTFMLSLYQRKKLIRAFNLGEINEAESYGNQIIKSNNILVALNQKWGTKLSNISINRFLYQPEVIKLWGEEKPPATKQPIFWKFSPGKGAILWNEFKQRSLISMGSWGVRDLNLNKWSEKEAFKKALIEGLGHRARNELWTFKDDIRPGNIIVAYGKKSILDFGVIPRDSKYEFDDKDEKIDWWLGEGIQGKQQWRKVIWLNVFEHPRDISSDNELYADLIKTSTVHKIGESLTSKLLNYMGEKAAEALRLSAEAAGSAREKITIKTVPTLEEIVKDIESKGFYFPTETIQNFHTCLLTKPFVILSGKTGTGKTKLVELYANAIHRVKGSNSYYKKISVQPNWNDNKPLLGYYNPFMKEYRTTPFLKFMKQAKKDCDNCNLKSNDKCSDKSKCTLKYFVCLDEMNLAHVEYYLADFLSAMETDDKMIDLQTDETKDGSNGQERINIPDNFYLVGTVNIDETTKEFSPKVLDRANSIEMETIDLEKWKELQQTHIRINETAFKVIKEIQNQLKKNNLQFGYRVCYEIMKYVEKSSLDLDRAIDLQIKQKILPKLCGDNNSRLRSSLEDLKDYLSTSKYEQSLAKTESMLKQLTENGFTTFYE